MPTKAVFDIEADNLIRDVTQIWCICIKDLNTREMFKFEPSEVKDGVALLSTYDMIIGHNICGYDIHVIKKFFPNWTYKKLRDTYCMSKLFDPDRPGGHSLESYGEQFKRSKPAHEDWTQFSPEMLYRCSEDVEINALTYKYLVSRWCMDWKWIDALELEQQYAINQVYQELAGVDLDVELAYDLLDRLDKEIAELDKILLERIPKRIKQVGATVTKPFKKNGELSKMAKDWLEQ